MRTYFTTLLLLLAGLVSAQCTIDVQVDTVFCGPAGGYLLSFDVEGTGDSGWVAPNIQMMGSYDTDELFQAGPFFEDQTTIDFVDIDNPDCVFTLVITRPEDCGTDPCFGFAAFVEILGDTLCQNSAQIQMVGSSSPYSITLTDGSGNPMNPITVNTSIYTF
ncbi:MAG: hypothetical protein AB8H12_08305, partial [Lewinella sp.]